MWFDDSAFDIETRRAYLGFALWTGYSRGWEHFSTHRIILDHLRSNVNERRPLGIFKGKASSLSMGCALESMINVRRACRTHSSVSARSHASAKMLSSSGMFWNFRRVCVLNFPTLSISTLTYGSAKVDAHASKCCKPSRRRVPG